MNKKLLVMAAVVLGTLALLRTAGNTVFWLQYLTASANPDAAAVARVVAPRIVISGTGGALPRATPDAESIAAEAIAAAVREAQHAGSRALVVHRHGHRVQDYFAGGASGATQIAGGELSPVPMALATGVLVDGRRLSFDVGVKSIQATLRSSDAQSWRNPWSAAARRRFSLAAAPEFLLKDAEGSVANTISQRVWRPLQASDAWLWGRNDAALRVDCCVVARLDDWMRIGDLLLQQGSYEGERIVSMDWMRQLLNSDKQGKRHPIWIAQQRPWTGAEPPAAREVYWFDLAPDLRLWLVPRRGLAILHWAAHASGASDTTIPNIIIRGLLDQAPAITGGGDLNDIVPGH
jgi:hypothetical protein